MYFQLRADHNANSLAGSEVFPSRIWAWTEVGLWIPPSSDTKTRKFLLWLYFCELKSYEISYIVSASLYLDLIEDLLTRLVLKTVRRKGRNPYAKVCMIEPRKISYWAHVFRFVLLLRNQVGLILSWTSTRNTRSVPFNPLSPCTRSPNLRIVSTSFMAGPLRVWWIWAAHWR